MKTVLPTLTILLLFAANLSSEWQVLPSCDLPSVNIYSPFQPPRCGPKCPGACGCGCPAQSVITGNQGVDTRGAEQVERKETLWIITSNNCPPCNKFFRDYAPNTENRNYLSEAYILKSYKLQNEKEWKDFKIKGTPTFRFANQKAADIVGYDNPTQLNAQLKAALEGEQFHNTATTLEPTPIQSSPQEEPKFIRGKDGTNGVDGKDAVVDYDKIYKELQDKFEVKIDYDELAKSLAKEIPQPDYEKLKFEITNLVIKKVKEDNPIFYDIRPRPKTLEK